MKRSVGLPDSIAMESADDYRKKSRFQDSERKRKERADRIVREVKVKTAIEKDGTAEAKIRGWVKDRDLPK